LFKKLELFSAGIISVFTAFLPTSTMAFEGEINNAWVVFSPDGCFYRNRLNSIGANVIFAGALSIENEELGLPHAGGSGFDLGNGQFYSIISVSVPFLENNCGFGNVTNLMQNGADGTRETDGEMFITFDGNTPTGRYSYDIGLYGVTNTVDVFTETLIASLPTVVLSGITGTFFGQQTLTVTFSEPVTGLTESDFSLTNASVVNGSLSAGAGNTYTLDIVAIASGAVSISLPAARVESSVLLNNTASNILNATVDLTSPDVVISGLPAEINGPAAFDATITFSENVTGFVAGDITISGGSVTALTGDGAIYTATVFATGGADLVMSIAAAVAQDQAGNDNTVSGTITTITNVTGTETSVAVARFMLTRANALLSNQPDLAGSLRGGNRPQFNADITEKSGIVAFKTGSDGPIWARLNANWSTDLGAESQYVFGAVGGYSKLSQNLLLGGMLQFDVITEVDGAAIASGTGWLLGPYFVAKTPDQPLYFEGSLLYGQTSNTISLLGTFTDVFSTERGLATLGVSGEVERGALVLLPFLDAKYTSDAQAAYIDGLGNPIAAQTIGLAQAVAGLDFEFSMNEATTLNGGVSGVWSYSSGNAVDPGYEGGRARLDLGVNRQVGMDGNLGLSGFYDGLGLEDFESYGVELRFSTEF